MKSAILVVVVMAMSLAACGGAAGAGAGAGVTLDGGADGGSSGAGLKCSITGTWRAHYVQTQGGCGLMSDQTLDIAAPAIPECTIASREVSSDGCDLDYVATCESIDKLGHMSWTVSVHELSERELEGSAVVEYSRPPSTCRSTYKVTMTKL